MTNNTASKTKFSPTPHSVTEIMQRVLFALIPGIAICSYFFGVGVIVNVLIATLAALVFEALMLRVRHKPLLPNLSDFSAIVTAWLFSLCLPPHLPWWINIIGIFFAIVVAKHLYGGLGHNLFNPAMVAYVVVLISFPVQMTQWTVPTGTAITPAATTPAFDSLSAATPLDYVKTERSRGHTLTETSKSPLMGRVAGYAWEWINLFILCGGLYLLYLRIIDWRIPVGLLACLWTVGWVFYLLDSDYYLSPWFHLFSGGTMLAAFFIATDPVTTCATPNGRILFGIGIGVFIFVIRTWGGYPDGIAFAVLLMNAAAPSIDYLTQNKAN